MQRRLEELTAWQMFHLNSINGGKAELKSFMRYNSEAQVEKEASLQDVMATLQSVAKPTQKK